MSLSHAIADYYFAHIGQLSATKQFHFASRLSAWNRDERAVQLLENCRNFMVPEPLNQQALREIFSQLIHTPATSEMHIPSYQERKPFFEQYAPLFGLELALFRLRHLETMYNIPAREAFLDVMPLQKLVELDAKLTSDPAACKTLSTYAVNVSYLIHHLVLQDTNVNVQAFYALGDTYDTADNEQLRLLIYLYTHCIIAETNFYMSPIPSQLLPTYQRMLAQLEPIIKNRLLDISLDAKLEYLVCCQICDFETSLFDDIYTECEQSVSPEGTFIVDTLNVFASRPEKKTFEGSEHRNVLFIMSREPYISRTAASSAASLTRE